MKNSNTASDNISICDKYIYGFDLYLYFTYINSSNSLKSYLKDLCRVICNFKSFSVGFRRKFLNHSNIYELFLTPKKYKKIIEFYSFFLILTTNSSLLITSISHSTMSPTSIFKSLVTALGMVVRKEFELGFALLTFVLYLNIIISPYLYLVTIIYVLIVIYIFTFKNNIEDNIKKVTFIY